MSNPASLLSPAPAVRPPQDMELSLAFLVNIADQLIPLFITGSIEISLARRMAINALEAYEPRSRADYINVARTIAFSMSALALLGQAAAPDMPMPEKMRIFGRANALNRSADQSERTMMKRRSCQTATLTSSHAATTPDPSPPDLSAPEPMLDDAAVQAAVAEAMCVFAACNPVETAMAARSLKTPQTVPPDLPAQPAFPAIHYTGVALDNRPISHRLQLLRRSAMQTVAAMRQPYYQLQTRP